VAASFADAFLPGDIGLPSTLIDDFGDHTLWDALQPGPMPSPEIVLDDDGAVHANLTNEASVRMEVSGAAADGHFVERVLGSVDLTSFNELRMWCRATVGADGSPDSPFLLRMEMGSAAMPIGSPGNDWHRLLPFAERNGWTFVRLALDDLDPLVAGAANAVRLTCVNTVASWTVWLDDLLACEPAMIADVNAALVGLLDGVLVIGAPVPSHVHVPGAAEPSAPWIRLIQYDAAYSDLRTTSQRSRTDFTDLGFRLGPESVAYDLHYRVEPVTSDPAEHAEMVEFILDVLGHRRTILVNGIRLPLERIDPIHRDAWSDLPVLRYRVSARQDRGSPQLVVPAQEIVLEADLAS
jgi:hypothetical protein